MESHVQEAAVKLCVHWWNSPHGLSDPSWGDHHQLAVTESDEEVAIGKEVQAPRSSKARGDPFIAGGDIRRLRAPHGHLGA
jgi:hypothetical protein